MDYQTYIPAPELQSFIKCFWTLEDTSHTVPVKQRIVPDGSMEMIFHYGEPYWQYSDDGTSILQPRCFVFGQVTRSLEIAPTGLIGMIAARFHPDGLTPFLDLPVAALENKATALDIIFGAAGAELATAVIDANDTRQRIGLIESFLFSVLKCAGSDTISRDCVGIILRTQGKIGVLELADQLAITRRKMERRFKTAIGISPKQLSRAVRLQSALKMLGNREFTSLTALALESGYYDQAHFIKDFKEFTGNSPKFFFSENLQLAALFAFAD